MTCTEKMLTPDGGLPTGCWDKKDLVRFVPAKPLEAEIDRLRLALREIVRMTGKGADAPMTADRWLDGIYETAIAALSPKEEDHG